MRAIPLLLVLANAVPSLCATASAAPYYIAIDRATAVMVYDLASFEATESGFSIWTLSVVDPPRWPIDGHPIAYDRQRETYSCRTRTYDTSVFQQFGADGTRWQSTTSSDPTGRYVNVVVPGNPEEPIFDAGCARAAPGQRIADRLDPRRIFDAADALAAYHHAADLLDRARNR